MKRTGWMFVVVLMAALSMWACDSGDDGGDGDTDGDTQTDGDDADGDVTDGDEPDGDVTPDADVDGDDDVATEHKTCDPEATQNFGGKIYGDCDTRPGVCENGATVGAEEWYPCVGDPDCCCDSENPIVDDIYPCEFDSCAQDGYCDPSCDPAPDPDCE